MAIEDREESGESLFGREIKHLLMGVTNVIRRPAREFRARSRSPRTWSCIAWYSGRMDTDLSAYLC